jgi:hypothetical protein
VICLDASVALRRTNSSWIVKYSAEVVLLEKSCVCNPWRFEYRKRCVTASNLRAVLGLLQQLPRRPHRTGAHGGAGQRGAHAAGVGSRFGGRQYHGVLHAEGHESVSTGCDEPHGAVLGGQGACVLTVHGSACVSVCVPHVVG